MSEPVTDVWSQRADAYRDAPEQREGEDLELIVAWAREAGLAGGGTALDVATGGGHVTRRLREAGLEVVSSDPAPGMKPDVICPAEHLPFATSSFDLVVTRIAPHHFEDIALAVGEMARVAGKLLIVEDTLYESEAVEEAERLRDPTHVSSYSEHEWRAFFDAAGFEVEAVEVVEKRHPLEDWLARTGTTEPVAARVRELLAPHIERDEYVDRKILLKGRKR